MFLSVCYHIYICRQKIILHCFKLLSSCVILYNEHMFLPIIFHASTMHCRSMHVLLPAALDWWHQRTANNFFLSIITNVVSYFLWSKVCTHKYSSSELMFNTIHNYIYACEETIPKKVCLHICTRCSHLTNKKI
jgi:hypothetical protein